MGIFARFFGKKQEGDDRGGKLVANPAIENPLSLQALFKNKLALDSTSLTAALRSYHRSMARARCEIEPELRKKGTVLGLAGWRKHVVRLVGFDAPMPADAVERCVAPSHYGPDLKKEVREHASHLLLYYGGHDPSAHEQYVALAALGGVLSQFGAIAILNESAHTSFPADALSGIDTGGDIMELLRTFPLLFLFCGFVKYDVEGTGKVWMRTHGAQLLGLPNFAARAEGHHEGQRYCDIFENILGYVRDSGAHLAAGHTMQIDTEEYLRFREPAESEAFPGDDSDLLVVEIVGPDEMNKKSRRRILPLTIGCAKKGHHEPPCRTVHAIFFEPDALQRARDAFAGVALRRMFRPARAVCPAGPLPARSGRRDQERRWLCGVHPR